MTFSSILMTNDFAWFIVLLVLCNPEVLVLDSALGGKVIKNSEQFKKYLIFHFLFISKEPTDSTRQWNTV